MKQTGLRMRMVEGHLWSTRDVAASAEGEESGNRLKIVHSTTNCTTEQILGEGAVGDIVGQDGPNVNAAFHYIDDIDVGSMEFDSIEEAEAFYMMYARATGFGVRKWCKRKDKKGIVRVRSWLCNKEGERHEKHLNRGDRIREPKAVTRVNCQAHLKVRLHESKQKYVVAQFVSGHCHRLCSPESVSFMRSHRKVGKSDLQQAVLMQQAGIRTSHIMRLLAVQAGGYRNLGFHETDMYNALNRQRQVAVGDGDSDSALAFLLGKQRGDPNLFFKYSVDGHGRLNRLLWADSVCRDDYRCFGDVLVFDSTYNTNQYRFPLVVLCGVNNHYSTCIFACAFIVREGDEGYDWVISTFLEAMNGRKSIAVVTDGDKSMLKCIKKFMPTAKHRLCSFHLEMNAATNVRDKEFLQAFKTCMFMNSTTINFETRWAGVVRRFRLENNEWVKKMYRKRELWAMAFLRGNFFGGVRSTQRCEKMHQVLKLHLTPKLKFFECLQTYDLEVGRLRHEERRQRAVTEHTTLLGATQLQALEKHAAELFTRSTFVVVREEMKKQGLFCMINGRDDGINAVHFMKHPYNYSYYTVVYNRSTRHMKCSCLKMETHGLPCCHMFRAMLFEELKKIPPNCIMKRWTR
ncbi:protein FAR1-RELATED SEQUENCE 5-like [Coffea eugenioides]|uniref:protein FAR1-RELATED SEQUENCE 5-like n=1 Tax=Coffea eugenioides TaxID=49369 RepID=UPI000F605B8F|nr:protein FAR1-RELATED SEQUENCE 5-like [Coffea eugenioides]